MQNLKFRAWDASQKYMAYQGNPENIKPFIFLFGDKELMMSINIKDKNGKEMFEGDIVNGGEFNGSYAYGIIEYHGSSFILVPIGRFLEGCCEIKSNSLYLEFIGNIFENPELLR